MKHVVLFVLGAFFVVGCGAADESAVQGAEESTASTSEAIVNAWTPWVSEESTMSSATCGGSAAAATKAQCSGAYCDNMRLYCGALPKGFTRTSSAVWWSDPYISEEAPNNVQWCPGGYVLDGIRATGSYADNISIHCAQTNFPTQGTNCRWMPWFSEENGGTQTFYYNVVSGLPSVALAVACNGSYCDNMTYYVCEPKCLSDADCFDSCNVSTGQCVVG